MHSLPDSARLREAEPDYSVHVKTVSRKGTRYTRRTTSQVNKPNMIKTKKGLTSVQYNGGVNSPHIKPEYINERLKSPSNIMRCKSIGREAEV